MDEEELRRNLLLQLRAMTRQLIVLEGHIPNGEGIIGGGGGDTALLQGMPLDGSDGITVPVEASGRGTTGKKKEKAKKKKPQNSQLCKMRYELYHARRLHWGQSLPC